MVVTLSSRYLVRGCLYTSPRAIPFTSTAYQTYFLKRGFASTMAKECEFALLIRGLVDGQRVLIGFTVQKIKVKNPVVGMSQLFLHSTDRRNMILLGVVLMI